jgi:hypothetical protein
MIETFRINLIKWNVAPLFFAGVLVWALVDITSFYKASPCELPEWHVAAIFVYMGALAGLISKIYDSLQKNRGKDDQSN